MVNCERVAGMKIRPLSFPEVDWPRHFLRVMYIQAHNRLSICLDDVLMDVESYPDNFEFLWKNQLWSQ